jgi:hypothetical protein
MGPFATRKTPTALSRLADPRGPVPVPDRELVNQLAAQGFVVGLDPAADLPYSTAHEVHGVARYRTLDYLAGISTGFSLGQASQLMDYGGGV